MKGLVVIEAPGKVATLTAILRRLGYGWRVVATKGHFVRGPASLWPLAITPQYEELERRASTRVERELREASKGRAVLIATDDDAEGDVIARDVLAVVKAGAASVSRVRLRAISADGVRAALAAPEPMDPRLARQGDARRILDRLIGHTFSRKGAPAGRILTPLLASLRRRPPVVGVARLVLEAADGGAAFRVDVAYTAAERPLWEARVAEASNWRGVRVAACEWIPAQPAWNYNDLVRSLCGRPVSVEIARRFASREEAACA